MLESGTCSVWRCTVCGEVWIWRNTPDGARAVTDIRRQHHLVRVT